MPKNCILSQIGCKVTISAKYVLEYTVLKHTQGFLTLDISFLMPLQSHTGGKWGNLKQLPTLLSFFYRRHTGSLGSFVALSKNNKIKSLLAPTSVSVLDLAAFMSSGGILLILTNGPVIQKGQFLVSFNLNFPSQVAGHRFSTQSD